MTEPRLRRASSTAHAPRSWAVRALAAVAAAVLFAPSPAAATNDPLFPRQWPLARIGAPDARATGDDVLIAVIDTGVDMNHPDLRGKVAGSAVCLDGPCREGGGQDDNGHGTEVAGIAVANTDNGRGIAAVAPGAKLLVAKVLDSDGAGRVDDINAGIRWAVDRGAKVINLSLGDPDFLLTSLVGTPLRPGIEYAWTRGAVPVLASGNYRIGVVDQGSSNYGDLNAMVVGATDRRNAVARYSTSIGNAKWGVVAPGGFGPEAPADDQVITTTLGGGYGAVAGTSAAAPHVSAALAALLGMGFNPTAAVERLLGTLDRTVSCGTGCQGLLNLKAAVAAGGPPANSPTSPPGGGGPGSPTTISGDGVGGIQGTGDGSGDRTEAATRDGDDDGGGRTVALVIALVLLVGVGAAVGGVGLTRSRA
ncbi:MAG TPA: S8 family serine peptidase [Acidimicrobiales bacterium]|nr:S8 family serine peptidase [Acidimicrobiales bacterium]